MTQPGDGCTAHKPPSPGTTEPVLLLLQLHGDRLELFRELVGLFRVLHPLRRHVPVEQQ